MSKIKNINEIQIDNIILVDTSYTSFHRFYATLKWVSMADQDLYKKYHNDPEYNWLENESFMEKYDKLYLGKIEKSVGKKVFNKSLIIFCMDTPKEQLWRTTDLKCNYKLDRIDLSLKNNFKPIFKHTYTHLIPEFIKNNNNIFKIKIDKLEADDVIAIISRYIEYKFSTKKVFLLSGDQDFYQLGRPNLCFINYKTKKPLNFDEEQARIELHKKLLLGDKSDCIPGIFPNKFPSKIKKELVESIDKFNEYIEKEENKNIKQRFIENSQLINFDFIPKIYKDKVIEEFNYTVNKFLSKNKNFIF